MLVGTPTKLNLIPSGIMPVIYLNQTDAGYDKQFLVYNGSQPYNIPEGVSVTIRGRKGDDYGITENAEFTVGSNLITVHITEQMTAVSGDHNIFELVFVDTEGLRVGTINVVFAIEPDALGEAVISESEISYAEHVMTELQSIHAEHIQIQQNKANIAQNKADIVQETQDRITAVKSEASARTAADTNLQRNIDIEATTRATADGDLRSSLNAEINNRTAADANLQTQINNIVAPSGGAPSAAEVENARIGINNTTYTSLGEAIRQQVGMLNVMADQPSYTWTIGHVIGSDGVVTANASGAYSNKILVSGGSRIIRVTPTKDSGGNNLIIHINQYEGSTFKSRTSLTDQGLTLGANTTGIVVNFARALSSGINMTQADINTYFNISLYRPAAVKAEMTSELKAVEILQSDAYGRFGGALSNLLSNTYTWTQKAWWSDAPSNMGTFFYVFNFGSPHTREKMTGQGTQIAVNPGDGSMAMRRIQSGSWTPWTLMSNQLGAVEVSQSQANAVYGKLLSNLLSNTYTWTAKSWWTDTPDNMPSLFYVFSLGAPSAHETMTSQGTQIAVAPSTGAMAMRRISSGTWTEWVYASPGYQSNPKYYAFGDSLTYGAVWDSDPETELYRGEWNDLIPTRIANAVGSMDFINGGSSGARFVKQSESDSSTIIGERIKSIDLSGYDLVTIGGGRNDSATALGNGETATPNDGTICGAVADILDYLTTNYPKMQIVMYGVTPQPDGVNIGPEYIYTRVFSGGWSLNTYYAEMRKLCARYGVPFIDWYDCTLILRWGQLSGGYNSGQRNWSHPLSSDIYKQMGNYLGGKVSSYYKG